MGLFDWVPTVGDVLQFFVCRFTDHIWVKDQDGKFVCHDCGKIGENNLG